MTSRIAWAALSVLATALYILVVGYFSVRIEAASLGGTLDWTNELVDVTTPGPAVLPSLVVAVASALLVALHLITIGDRSRVTRSVVTSGVSFLMLSGFVVGTWAATNFAQPMTMEMGDVEQASPAILLLREAGLSPALLATAGISAAVFAVGLVQIRRTQRRRTA